MSYPSFNNSNSLTIVSYNCGGLSDHYDYKRAACMEILMAKRFMIEPENMVQFEKIQQLALKIIFEKDTEKLNLARKEWDQKNYSSISKQITLAPNKANSPNAIWYREAEQMISSFKTRPVTLCDQAFLKLKNDLNTLNTDAQGCNLSKKLVNARNSIAKKIFANIFMQDIFCFQETQYLDSSLFPDKYTVHISGEHCKTGIAWDKSRFTKLKIIDLLTDRGFALSLLDTFSKKIILVTSCHLSGCNPFQVEDTNGVKDADKGDLELRQILKIVSQQTADLKIIGMDANVTPLHPRLKILKQHNFALDCNNFIESTCTNPSQILNTRIDWIAMQSNILSPVIENIPLQVPLNNTLLNFSDHKPIAAKIRF